jgi:hypothetical protein
MPMTELLSAGPRVINVGLPAFADDLRAQDCAVVQLDWSPPARGRADLLAALDRLAAPEVARRIEAANAEAVRRMLAGDPVLVDVRPASEAIPELGERMILHAGPPIEWPRMCGPLQGAIAGAIVLEGWAPDLDAAAKSAASSGVRFQPNHHFGAVGPMTGLITRSMPVLVVENRAFGNRAFCTLNEGLGKVMRFGGNDAEVLKRLRWIAEVLGPALSAAIRATGGIALKPLIARGLAMGDEMHQRNVAGTGLLLRELTAPLARTLRNPDSLAAALEFISRNDQFFLNVAMAMGKAIMDPVRGVANSTVVSAMCRNGSDFGIRVSTLGDRWFTAPVEMPRGLYFPGYGEADANPDMGDSAIVETVGLGGFAMAASPAVAGFVGAGSASDAIDYTRRMVEITVARNPDWTIPALDFAGVPCGIDVRKVLETGIAPTINTGIAHRKPGVGQVGAGIVNAPISCFEQALVALAAELSR